MKELGSTGLKFDPFAHTNYLYGDHLTSNLSLFVLDQRRACEVISAVREAVGADMDIMVETHAMLNGQLAVSTAEQLSSVRMTWYEEPVGPESAETLAALRRRLPSNVSICVGERHYKRHSFRPALEQHLCDIIMPDITLRRAI